MPLQNRVDPFGNIRAVSQRGHCMGNRGILHNDQQQLTRYYKHKNWIICQLNFKNRQRTVMSPGKYTELFFLDEATALAAGHRPCWECNRVRAKTFKQCWQLAHPQATETIDQILHRERVKPRQPRQHTKITYFANLDNLPNGSFISLHGQPYLVCDNCLHLWSFTGYGEPIAKPKNIEVMVLTPQSTVRTLLMGYQPLIA